MKKIIIQVVLIFAFIINTKAQDNLAFFQIEENNYLQFENYLPNTTLEFYSMTYGGKQLEKINLKRNEITQQVFSSNNTPAFVLNRKTLENSKGTDKVQFIDNKEFIAKNISLEIVAGIVTISLDAQINGGNNIEFQLLKKDNNGDYSLVKSIAGLNTSDFNKYTLADFYTEHAAYKLQIVKEAKKIRYTSDIIANPLSTIKVYPTLSNDKLFVDFENTAEYCPYFVFDISGKIVQKGIFTDNFNSIDIIQLIPGNYVISLNTENQKLNFKFVKY